VDEWLKRGRNFSESHRGEHQGEEGGVDWKCNEDAELVIQLPVKLYSQHKKNMRMEKYIYCSSKLCSFSHQGQPPTCLAFYWSSSCLYLGYLSWQCQRHGCLPSRPALAWLGGPSWRVALVFCTGMREGTDLIIVVKTH